MALCAPEHRRDLATASTGDPFSIPSHWNSSLAISACLWPPSGTRAVTALFSGAQSVGRWKERNSENQLVLVKELVARDMKIIPSPYIREMSAVLFERPN